VATAHDDAVALAARKLVVRQSAHLAKRELVLATEGATLAAAHDPRRVDGAALLVRTTGASPGRTRLLTLEGRFWRADGRGGFRYKDPQALSGGVKKVVVTRDKIAVIAKGAGVSPAIDGPIESLWVHLRLGDQWYCAQFGEKLRHNALGKIVAGRAAAPLACPAAVCGNGDTELGEQCDDGNLDDADGCTNACALTTCAGETFASTWEAIRTVVFERGGCNAMACHGAAPGEGNLLLAGEDVYARLLDVPASSGLLDRLEPGDHELSFLYLKLAAATRPDLYPGVPGAPMPAGGLPPIDEDVLEGVKRWIRAGAPVDGVVDGTAHLLGACLPPPTPPRIRPLPTPAAGAGVQIAAPPWPLAAASENEICYATYYDFAQSAPGIVPDWARSPCPLHFAGEGRECFRYHATTLAQDPQFHHSVVTVYRGAAPPSDPSWGPWTCKGGERAGVSCEPTRLGVAAPAGADCGPGGGCGGAIVPSVSCLEYGPADLTLGGSLGAGFAGSQEPLSTNTYATGVYDALPMRGIVVWNAHAFNLTGTDTAVAQYLNIEFATPDDQRDPVRGIFDTRDVFVQNVPPFERREYCSTYTLPDGAHLFELSSHMHKRGVLFRIWPPPNGGCSASGPGPCLPGSESPIYSSTEYSDPVKLRFDPPRVLASGSAGARTYKYCAVYDNGASDPATVKRRSVTGCVGTHCFGGVREGQPCNDDRVCDSSPGAGDGACDACPVVGGDTSEDEMLILLGAYFLPQ
jgi:cysteine-rich repeat protein